MIGEGDNTTTKAWTRLLLDLDQRGFGDAGDLSPARVVFLRKWITRKTEAREKLLKRSDDDSSDPFDEDIHALALLEVALIMAADGVVYRRWLAATLVPYDPKNPIRIRRSE